jgi:hypothetical protein
VSGPVLEAVALSRYAFYRPLEALEVTGLVSVTRRRGCRPTLSAQGALALKSWAPPAEGPTDRRQVDRVPSTGV